MDPFQKGLLTLFSTMGYQYGDCKDATLRSSSPILLGVAQEYRLRLNTYLGE